MIVNDARSLIHEHNFAVGSAAVECILKPQSWVPTSNAFSDRLGFLGFNIFCALVVDLLHEFEISVWKMLFVHLLRIITAQGPGLIHQLDQRQTLTFGPATIRRFLANSSEMKCLAARNFEDLLQCSIPVFDGLLPEPHNQIVLKLLFTMAHWHGLAKLWMHSELTLKIMDHVTSALGQQFRQFKNTTCAAYEAHKLSQEVRARARCHLRKADQAGHKSTRPTCIVGQAEVDDLKLLALNVKRIKVFNLQTYKFHALGDYVSTICRYGTSDSYSTEPGELEHRSPKAGYRRTDRKSFVKQLTQIERRQARIRRIGDKAVHRPHVEISEIARSPEVHHHIGLTQKYPVHIGSYLISHPGDPAVKNFVPKLKEHLLRRINAQTGPTGVGDEQDINSHSQGRPAQDVINPRTSHCNIMVLRSSNDIGRQGHKYIYGKVLGIYHVNVIFIGHDPADVLWGCHIIPHFVRGRRYADGSGVSACAKDKDDWREYYVNRFVDCDMLMRFHYGLGVGHVYSHHHATQVELQQEDITFHASLNDDVEDPADDTEIHFDTDESDGTDEGSDIEQPFGSNKSLLDQFDEMYDDTMDSQLSQCYLFSNLSPIMMPISGLISLDAGFDFVGYVSVGEQKVMLFPLYCLSMSIESLKEQISLIGYIATPIMHNGVEIMHHSVCEPGSVPIYTQLDLAPRAYTITDHLLYIKYDWPTPGIQDTTGFLAEYPLGHGHIDITVALSQLFQPFQTTLTALEFDDGQLYEPPLTVPESASPVFDAVLSPQTLAVPEAMSVVDPHDSSVNMTGGTTNVDDDATQPDMQQADGPETLTDIQEQYPKWKRVLVHLRVEMRSDIARGLPINPFLLMQVNHAEEKGDFVCNLFQQSLIAVGISQASLDRIISSNGRTHISEETILGLASKWLSALLSLMKWAASIAIADGGLMTNFTLQSPCPFALQSEMGNTLTSSVRFLHMGIAKSLVFYMVYRRTKSANAIRILADVNRAVFRDSAHLPPATLAFVGACCYSALLSYLLDLIKTGGVSIDSSQFPAVSVVYDGLLRTTMDLYEQEGDPELPILLEYLAGFCNLRKIDDVKIARHT
ncbi:hypothetical protein EDD22DRAFT_962397 [Suillus occidentalis]|nr:hypothetical protein EDD22DRAFT_962397 [Suillus occidentalis]